MALSFASSVGGPVEQGQQDGAQPIALGGADGVRGEIAGGAPLVVGVRGARASGLARPYRALREDPQKTGRVRKGPETSRSVSHSA